MAKKTPKAPKPATPPVWQTETGFKLTKKGKRVKRVSEWFNFKIALTQVGKEEVKQ